MTSINIANYLRALDAKSVAQLVLTVFLGSLIGLSFYRVFFHPYAKYPGPLLAKLTSWYSVYHAYYGDLHSHIWECHQKYGDVVRYGPNRILVNTQAGFKSIYGHGSNVRKSKAYLRISLVPGVHPTLGTIDDREHGKLRRILNQGLSDVQIRGMDDKLRSAARLFAKGLGERLDRFAESGVPRSAVMGEGDDGWGTPKNVAHWCDYFTFDVMSQLVFGTSYGLLTSSENHWIVEGVLGQVRRVGFCMQLPEIEDMGLHRFLYPTARAKALRFSQKSREIMEQRKAKGGVDEPGKEPRRTDMFSKLLTAKDTETGEGLSNKQLWAESNLLIIAGSDTSSTGMAATFFYLSRDPKAYARMAAEVRAAFPDPESVGQGPQLASCAYLRACIQEAIRLSPSASGAMWREALPGGLHIPAAKAAAGQGEDGKKPRRHGDLVIPEGLEVGTGIFSLNHSADYFPDPLAYRPERWLVGGGGDEEARRELARAKAAFATFSTGPRNCVGKGLAMVEMAVAVAAVVARYDFRAPREEELARVGEWTEGRLKGHYRTKWAFTSDKDGPWLQFKRVVA